MNYGLLPRTFFFFMVRHVAYIHSEELIAAADLLPSNLKRASLVHGLIDALGLLDCGVHIIEPTPASRREMAKYHDEDYVSFLMGDDEEPPSRFRKKAKRSVQEHEAFNLVDDAPFFDGLPLYVSYVAGASLAAARALKSGSSDVAISWTGGRHHARRAKAGGFCYVQDIVLAINELRKRSVSGMISVRPASIEKALEIRRERREGGEPGRTKIGYEDTRTRSFSRIFYLDLDIHHGDGVERAFASTDSVLTCSLHLHAPLFYPGTGGDLPRPKESHINIPLGPGLSDTTLIEVFDTCVLPLVNNYKPDALVLQCGCDGLAGDPLGEWNLTSVSFGHCIRALLALHIPALLLGGGGYDSANAARHWAYLTGIVLDKDLKTERIPVDLPTEMYRQFAPDFMMEIPPKNTRKDENTTILESLQQACCDWHL